jgi:hypothetical protein
VHGFPLFLGLDVRISPCMSDGAFLMFAVLNGFFCC